MKFIAVLFALAISSAQAAEVKVLDIQKWFPTYVTSEFKVNRQLGRAWVEVTVKEQINHDRYYTGDHYKQLVDGLAFNTTTGMITFDYEGQQFECAKVSSRISNTNCSFVTKETVVEVDTGFEIRKVPHLEVYLVTK